MACNNVNLILLFSGKRKSGKDFICEKLQERLKYDSTIIRISAPLKSLYAKSHGLDIEELMSDSPYKEKYRLAMINWSEEIRAKDKGYFCRAACEAARIQKLWIVSDIRRKTDVEWFKEIYKDKMKLIRIHADVEVREKRGWKFTERVDDVQSECDLDDFNDWDLKISNNNNDELEYGLILLLSMVKDCIKL